MTPQTLAYKDSKYISDFGLTVETESGPLQTTGRILEPPTLKYGDWRQPKIVSYCGLDFPLIF